MKKLLIGFVCAILTLPVAAQTATKKMHLSGGFSEIQIDGVIEVTLVQSDRHSVEIVYDESWKMEAFIDKNTLIIKVESSSAWKKKTCVRATVRTPYLKRLSVSGANTLTSTGKFASDSFKLRASGACSISGLDITATDADLGVSGACSVGFTGKIGTTQCNLTGGANIKMKLQSNRTSFDVSGASHLEADLLCNDLKIKASGASIAQLSGKTDALTVGSSGASQVDTGKMTANDANVNCSGASTTNIRVLGTLNANLSGASHATYTGDPRLGTIEIGEMCSLSKTN